MDGPVSRMIGLCKITDTQRKKKTLEILLPQLNGLSTIYVQSFNQDGHIQLSPCLINGHWDEFPVLQCCIKCLTKYRYSY